MNYKIFSNIFIIILFFMNINNIASHEIILSSGIGNYTHQQLWNQYTAYKTYSDKKIITSSSILLYYIENGFLQTYKTNDIWNSENYQSYIKEYTQLKSYPTLYCDSTIGMCSQFNKRIIQVYNNLQNFIDDSILRAKKFNYDGYIVDFEPDEDVNTTLLTDFILEWNDALNYNNLTLNIWIGSDTLYDDRIFNNSNLILSTMNTYQTNYNEFIDIANSIQVNINNINRIGFGLLTNYGNYNNLKNIKNIKNKDNPINSSDIDNIINWLLLSKNSFLSLWSSHIDPSWHLPLYKFLHKKIEF